MGKPIAKKSSIYYLRGDLQIETHKNTKDKRMVSLSGLEE